MILFVRTAKPVANIPRPNHSLFEKRTGEFRTKTDQFSFILRPSGIEGIGVFATHNIAKGSYLRLFSPSERVKIRKENEKHRVFLHRYSVELKGEFHGPEDFGRMSIGWYLNHRARPNAEHRKYRYYATRDIRAGEEITINYDTLES